VPDLLDSHCCRRMAIVTLFVTTSLLLMTSPLSAQLGGENIRGDLGLKSGSQAPPGMYIGDLFYYYRTGEVRFANGASLSGPGLNIFANVFLFNYVTKKKLLGGRYGFMVAPAILSSKLALPRLNIGEQTWGLADLYIQPIQLGWTLKHADAFAGYAFYAPVGRFTAGADNNTGLGMWSNELSGGTTVFFDPGKKWHASAAGFYEIHSSKRDEDLKIGDLFTLEGGVGRSFLQGYANAGLAYYGQWKVTEDSGRDVSPLVAGRKGSMVGLGPELNMPLGHHPVFLTFRYLFDVRSRLATQGQSTIFSLVYVRPAAAPPAPAASCSAQPLEALAGEPVTVTANATNFEPKHPLTYQWNSSLGNVSGKGNTATIDTIGAAGGSYTARARITDLKVKNAGAASCTVSFIVKELPKNPPATSSYAATWANTLGLTSQRAHQ